MNSRLPIRAAAAVALGTLLTLGAGACSKKTTNPEPAGPLATLESAWPGADGIGWSYRWSVATWTDTLNASLFATPGEVPAAPSPAMMSAIVAGLPKGPDVLVDTTTFSLQFAGEITTGPGVVAQNLVETTGPWPGTTRGTPVQFDPLLDRLWRARPDLQPILGLRHSSPTPLGSSSPTLFLHGGPWRRNADAIVTYGQLDTLPNWKYLDSDLTPGAAFSIQLIPSLSNQVVLRASIAGKRTVTTPAGTFANTVGCDYVVDYGISEVTDDQGSSIGYQRLVSYGSVAYADSVGPVWVKERSYMAVISANSVTAGAGSGEALLLALLAPPGLRPGPAFRGRGGPGEPGPPRRRLSAVRR